MRLCVVGVIFLELIITSAVDASEISGRVRNLQGEPIAGATVVVRTAAPRSGVALRCPSCFPDCGKEATTDAEGRFTIGELDSTLTFFLTAMADGYRAGSSKKLNPSDREAIIELAPIPLDLPPNQQFRGRVLDADRKPVAGAEVRPFGLRNDEHRILGAVEGWDGAAVSDRDGRFVLASRERAKAIDIEVRSPRHAMRKFLLQPTGEEERELVVDEGATIRGRVVKDGRPVSGVAVGISHTDTNYEIYLGEMTIGTDDEGKFEFKFVPPAVDFFLYTKMSSMKGQGALKLQRVTVGESKSVIELGDLELGPAHALAGRIVLADGKPLAKAVQLSVNREGARDFQRVKVEADGRFRVEDVPHDEPLTLHARVPGYQVASVGNRFQRLDASSIGVFCEGPREDIEIVYQPGERKR